ncbi:MAG: sugar phosphate isomerase/epimerase [Sphingobium sp.]|nr:MAG: sugar phosphate isomerase/epimerase [Sphingobium sp.]
MAGAVFDRRQLMGAAAGCLVTGLAGARVAAAPLFRSIGTWTSVGHAPLLADAGYGFIEEEVERFLVPDASEAAFAATLDDIRALPVPVRTLVRFLPPTMQSVGQNTDHDAIAVFAETVFARARRVGVETIVFGSPRSRRIPDGFSREIATSQLVDLCKRLAPIAQAQGIILALEPLNRSETNFVNRVDEGAAIVEAVGHPHVRLVADIYHMLREEEGPESLIRAGALIQHVQVAEKQGRRAPGTSGEDFSPYFSALQSIRYGGRLSIECLWSDIAGEAPNALRALEAQLER